MNTVIEFLFPTPEAGLVWALVLIIAGILTHQYTALEVSDRRDRRAQKLKVEQDQAIAITTPALVIEDTCPGRRWPSIPVQRVTNGEDLIGGDPR